MPQLTLDIPNDKIEMVGRAYGIIQQEDETATAAWTRLKENLIIALKRPVIQMRRRELEAANVAAETETIITEA